MKPREPCGYCEKQRCNSEVPIQTLSSPRLCLETLSMNIPNKIGDKGQALMEFNNKRECGHSSDFDYIGTGWPVVTVLVLHISCRAPNRTPKGHSHRPSPNTQNTQTGGADSHGNPNRPERVKSQSTVTEPEENLHYSS